MKVPYPKHSFATNWSSYDLPSDHPGGHGGESVESQSRIRRGE